MAGKAARRVNSRSERYRVRQTYEDGNAVRKLNAYPVEEPKKQAAARRRVSLRVQKNRMRARNMGAGYFCRQSARLHCFCALIICRCVPASRRRMKE